MRSILRLDFFSSYFKIIMRKSVLYKNCILVNYKNTDKEQEPVNRREVDALVSLGKENINIFSMLYSRNCYEVSIGIIRKIYCFFRLGGQLYRIQCGGGNQFNILFFRFNRVKFCLIGWIRNRLAFRIGFKVHKRKQFVLNNTCNVLN